MVKQTEIDFYDIFLGKNWRQLIRIFYLINNDIICHLHFLSLINKEKGGENETAVIESGIGKQPSDV